MAAITPTYVGNDLGYLRKDANKVNVKELKIVHIETETTDNGAAGTAVLPNYGLSHVLAVRGIRHTTNYNSLVIEEPTTSNAGGNFVITVPGLGTPTKKRSYLIFGVTQ